jgi:hypothetical protein
MTSRVLHIGNSALILLSMGAASIGAAQAAGNAHTFSQVDTSAVDYRATPLRAAKDCQALGRELSSSARIVSTKFIAAADGVPEHCRIDGVIPAPSCLDGARLAM